MAVTRITQLQLNGALENIVEQVSGIYRQGGGSFELKRFIPQGTAGHHAHFNIKLEGRVHLDEQSPIVVRNEIFSGLHANGITADKKDIEVYRSAHREFACHVYGLRPRPRRTR